MLASEYYRIAQPEFYPINPTVYFKMYNMNILLHNPNQH